MASNPGQLVIPPETSFSFLRSRLVITDLVVLVLIGLAIIGVLAGEPLAITLSALVLVATMLARAWARVALVDVRYHCAVSRHRLMVGETFSLSMVIENRKVLPIPWLRVIDFIPQGVSVDGTTALFSEVPGTHQIEAWLRLGAYERIRLPRQLEADAAAFTGLAGPVSSPATCSDFMRSAVACRVAPRELWCIRGPSRCLDLSCRMRDHG